MSHSLTLNSDLGVIVLRARKTMSLDELRRVFPEMLDMPGFRQGLCLVADFRGSGTVLTGEDVQQLAANAGATDASWGDTKWAIIASDDVLFGLSRMFGALTDGHQVTTHTFRTVAAADDWLGLGIDMNEILARTPAPRAAEVLT